MPTKIAWTNESWNAVTGCTKVSEGCRNCYAERMCRRFWKQWDREPPPDHFKVKLHPDRLEQPLRWRKPRRIFVCSMSDLFHDEIELGFTMSVWKVMAEASWHTFQVLTKRVERMKIAATLGWQYYHPTNVWLGSSVSTQDDADYNIPFVLQTPAAVRFVSVEPMLGPLNLAAQEDWLYCIGHFEARQCRCGLDWVIIGCESGPGRRPMELEWAIDLVNQCKAAGVACFVKQIPINGKVSHDPAEWPEELRVREYPKDQP